MFKKLLVLALILSACNTILADEITLKNGEKLIGQLLKVTKKYLLFETQIGVPYRSIPVAEVTQVIDESREILWKPGGFTLPDLEDYYQGAELYDSGIVGRIDRYPRIELEFAFGNIFTKLNQINDAVNLYAQENYPDEDISGGEITTAYPGFDATLLVSVSRHFGMGLMGQFGFSSDQDLILSIFEARWFPETKSIQPWIGLGLANNFISLKGVIGGGLEYRWEGQATGLSIGGGISFNERAKSGFYLTFRYLLFGNKNYQIHSFETNYQNKVNLNMIHASVGFVIPF